MRAVLATKTMDEVELEDSGRCVGLGHIDKEEFLYTYLYAFGGHPGGPLQTVEVSFEGDSVANSIH